jgi:hypothetical protein
MQTARTPDAGCRPARKGRDLGLLLLAAVALHPAQDHALADAPFQMADTLVCTIETSTQPDETGRKITLSALTTDSPKAVFENHIRSSMVRIFESEAALVIQLVAAVSGSVDTIVIDKQRGRFAHVAAGAFPADVHALSETGTCRPEQGGAR